MCSEYMLFNSDIGLPFLIMVHNICFVRNVSLAFSQHLFIGMFRDFMAKIPCNVLR